MSYGIKHNGVMPFFFTGFKPEHDDLLECKKGLLGQLVWCGYSAEGPWCCVHVPSLILEPFGSASPTDVGPDRIYLHTPEETVHAILRAGVRKLLEYVARTLETRPQ
jgi:hypothetical protein